MSKPKTKKKKGKNYMVLVTGYAKVLVINAESKKKAMEYAINEMSMGDFHIDELEVDDEITNEFLQISRVEADCVAEDRES